jgi:hypothetical protein
MCRFGSRHLGTLEGTKMPRDTNRRRARTAAETAQTWHRSFLTQPYEPLKRCRGLDDPAVLGRGSPSSCRPTVESGG